MIKNIGDFEKILGFQNGELKAALASDEEVELSVPAIVVRTAEEHKKFMANVEEEKKQKYEAGKEKGIKDEINKYIESNGIVALEGKAKTFDNFAESLKVFYAAETGKPKAEMIQTLEKEKKQLQTNYG